MQSVPWQDDLKQESVSLVTRAQMGATPVILGSDLALEENTMTLIHVETTLDLEEIMGISVLKPWDTFWYSERQLLIHYIFVQGAKKINRYASFELFGHQQYWPEMWKHGSILRSLLKDMQNDYYYVAVPRPRKDSPSRYFLMSFKTILFIFHPTLSAWQDL